MEDKEEEGIPKFYGAAVVGERGQIVIPVEARHDMGITSGEKMIILRAPQGNMLLIAKAESVSQLLSKVMKHISQFESMLKAGDEPPE
jgi:AbrB family looped-hinge helix DNA binding protein